MNMFSLWWIVNELPILYFKGVEISKLRCISIMMICFIFANSADFEQVSPWAAFHLGRHC